MGIKGLNKGGDDFADKFTRARVFDSTGLDAVNPIPPPAAMSASGGTTNDYTEGGQPYRSHTFTGNGAFSIPTLGTPDIGTTIDCMVVGGGGGGGHNWAAGGGLWHESSLMFQ